MRAPEGSPGPPRSVTVPLPDGGALRVKQNTVVLIGPDGIGMGCVSRTAALEHWPSDELRQAFDVLPAPFIPPPRKPKAQ